MSSTPSDLSTAVLNDDLVYARPVAQIRSVNVDVPSQRIYEGMKKYEDASRSYDFLGFERPISAKRGAQVKPSSVIIRHRPEDARVPQLFRVPINPDMNNFDCLTHFDIGSGRTIRSYSPIDGDDWRGVYRAGGAIIEMDLDGKENFQLWRYWEDDHCDIVLPKIDGELNNAPGKGRIERVTHDDKSRCMGLVISPSQKLMVYIDNKENSRDMLVYMSKLVGGTDTVKPDSSASFSLRSTRVTNPKQSNETSFWWPYSISIDDKYILLVEINSMADRPLYTIDISGTEPGAPQRVVFPGAQTGIDSANGWLSFSRDPARPHLLYCISNAFSDFEAVVAYDVGTHEITHVTTAEPSFNALRPIPWEAQELIVSRGYIAFTVNFEGWARLYVMPLQGPNENRVLEVRLEWEQGWISLPEDASSSPNPHEIVIMLASVRARSMLAHVDLTPAFAEGGVRADADSGAYIEPNMRFYSQVSTPKDESAIPPKLLKFKSFDGMEIPTMYYHPNKGESRVPVIIYIHGGPESQSKCIPAKATHGYFLNELECAMIYPNVRGSSGYGKSFLAADDVEKREDAIKDIGSLLDHIHQNMRDEIDPSRIAVMGGSYGGFMVFSSLVRFSNRLTCGLSNFGMTHLPSFLENTAAMRRTARRREYGDESDPVVRAFLERISPINSADKITVPTLITHGENDTRVPLAEAIQMFRVISQRVPTGLIVCEKEGHGYKQKTVIEFVDAAGVQFFEKYLVGNHNA